MKRFFICTGIIFSAVLSAAAIDFEITAGSSEKPGFRMLGNKNPENTITSDGKAIKVTAAKGNVSLIGNSRVRIKEFGGKAEFEYTIRGKGKISPTLYYLDRKGKVILRRLAASVTLKGSKAVVCGKFRVSAEYANGREPAIIIPGFYINSGSEMTISGFKGQYVDRDPEKTVTPRAISNKNLSALSKKLSQTAANLKKRGKRPEIMFIGDSITHGWTGTATIRSSGGKEVWEEFFAPAGAVNFGIPSDQIENVLWRITEGGQLECQPRTIVLMIGTNNIGKSHDMPEDIANGIGNLLKVMKEKVPDVKIILCAITPRNANLAIVINETNKLLPEIAKANGAEFIDPTNVLTGGSGNAGDRKIFYDGLHLSAEGYRRFASILIPRLRIADK